MRFQDVDEQTELTFLHCLHDERPDDPRMMSLRRRWYEGRCGRGLVAKVVVLDSGDVAGLAQRQGVGCRLPHRHHEPPCTCDVLRVDVIAMAGAKGIADSAQR